MQSRLQFLQAQPVLAELKQRRLPWGKFGEAVTLGFAFLKMCLPLQSASDKGTGHQLTVVPILAFRLCRIIALDETRSNPAAPGAVVGITGSSAALVVAQQKADFALTSDHLAGARVRFIVPGVLQIAFKPPLSGLQASVR